jgi:hypothetical protein
MEICKNCGYSLEQCGLACPNCGYYSRAAKSRGSLPDWALLILGFLTAIISMFILPVLGPLVLTAVYFSIKEKQEVFARGLGYGLLTVVVLIMGAIALCFAMIFSPGFKFG